MAAESGWKMWPFGLGSSSGLPLFAKYLFVALLIGALALLIRLLFGPGGPMREAWMDEDREDTDPDGPGRDGRGNGNHGS